MFDRIVNLSLSVIKKFDFCNSWVFTIASSVDRDRYPTLLLLQQE